MKITIPVSRPIISSRAKKYLLDCVKTGWVSSQGQYINKFERAFAKNLGIKHAITATSGTAALHLALAALGLKPGDEVILPAFTMISPLFATLYLPAKPVLVDAHPQTWTLDPSQVAEKISARTRVIIAVHIYGHPAEMGPLKKLAAKFHLILIEDAAEGHGSAYLGRPAGTLGDVACFSFYANKLITTGEGGMVVTNNPRLAKKIRLLKDMAHSPKTRFLHTHLGFNYRFTNLQAALGLSQLSLLAKVVSKKRKIAMAYSQKLKTLPGLTLPPQAVWAKNSYWMYAILVNPGQFGCTAKILRQKLLGLGIDTRRFFIPLHRQIISRKLDLFKGDHYPIADKLSSQGLYLPSGPNITNREIKSVCIAIHKIHDQL